MKNKILILFLVCFSVCSLFIMGSCEDVLIGSEEENTPSNNFEYFWQTFDTHYGLFEVKNTDWNGIYDQFKPVINDQMTDPQLYEVLTGMMVLLNDNHLNLYPTNGDLPVFPGGVLSYRNGVLNIIKVQDDYDIDVAKKYVDNYDQVTPNLGFGIIPEGDLSYLNIQGTDGLKVVEKRMEDIMASVAGSRGIIVDIRGFYGGFDPVSQYLAGCFATEKKLYMTTRKRNGPAHSDFTAPAEWYVEPQSSNPYIKPVILLTSRFTQSAGETFALAMRQYGHVTTLGDTTAGSFSDNPNFEMYNGWIFSVSVGDYRGPGNISYEGTGLPPDVYSKTSREQLLIENDITLESAIGMLE